MTSLPSPVVTPTTFRFKNNGASTGVMHQRIRTHSLPFVTRSQWKICVASLPRVTCRHSLVCSLHATREDMTCVCRFPKDDLATAIVKWGAREGGEKQEDSLRNGKWAKLICGASFEDVVDVRNLSLIYTLVGIDCIDCAAEKAVVAAVTEGIQAAVAFAKEKAGVKLLRPWLMVSINDDSDPHFRKAAFDPAKCPPDCPRPCEKICPADAIKFERISDGQPFSTTEKLLPLVGGVITERCYGCGRCLSVCPLGLIEEKTYVRGSEEIAKLLRECPIDAIEIHSGPGHIEAFKSLWARLSPSFSCLKLVAVSIPDMGQDMGLIMKEMERIMGKNSNQRLLLWQLDGKPMSGDIGDGSAWAAIRLAKKVFSLPEVPAGFVQLAGGTNSLTFSLLQREGFLQKVKGSSGEKITKIAGVAYGGYARKIVTSVTSQASCTSDEPFHVEDNIEVLLKGVLSAAELIGPLKVPHN